MELEWVARASVVTERELPSAAEASAPTHRLCILQSCFLHRLPGESSQMFLGQHTASLMKYSCRLSVS